LELFVLPVKTQVVIGGAVDGVITAIIIRPAFGDVVSVDYECDWWDGNDVKTRVFNQFSVAPIGDVRTAQIGFHPRGIE
jgi:hypothetical protein